MGPRGPSTLRSERALRWERRLPRSSYPLASSRDHTLTARGERERERERSKIWSTKICNEVEDWRWRSRMNEVAGTCVCKVSEPQEKPTSRYAPSSPRSSPTGFLMEFIIRNSSSPTIKQTSSQLHYRWPDQLVVGAQHLLLLRFYFLSLTMQRKTRTSKRHKLCCKFPCSFFYQASELLWRLRQRDRQTDSRQTASIMCSAVLCPFDESAAADHLSTLADKRPCK